MSYTALYRKFRPKTFDEVKGQDHIVTALKNQVINGRTSHAYLFCGTRGTGKTSIAKILARAVNCENPKDGSPCGECALCRSIAEGSSMNVIEIDAASNNSVDDVRQIVEEVTYSPATGKYKVYIIDEVHMLSISAFNALLKTLEEPPEYVIFILATTEVNKLPITILSRCQRYDFRRISIDTISDRIRELTSVEGINIEDKAIRYVAKTADGSMRDALSLLDQCIAFYFGKELTYDRVLDVLGAVDTAVFSDLFRCIIASDVTGSLKLLEEMVIRGRELTAFVSDMTWYLRNLLLLKSSDANEDIIDLSTENMNRLREEAAMADHEIIMRYIRVFSELSGQIRYSNQKRVLIEVALIKLCIPATETDSESVLDRIRVIEEKLEKGIVVRSDTGVINGNTNQGAGSGALNASQIDGNTPNRVIEKALPEDVKNVVSHWNLIVTADSPLNIYLPYTYPSVGEGDTLLVVCKDNFGYKRIATNNASELKEVIASVTGKDMNVQVVFTEDSGISEDTFPDVRAFISEQIDFEIEEMSEEELREEEDFPDIET